MDAPTPERLTLIATELRVIAKEAIAAAKEIERSIRLPREREREALESIRGNVDMLISAGDRATKEPDMLEWIANRCKMVLED